MKTLIDIETIDPKFMKLAINVLLYHVELNSHEVRIKNYDEQELQYTAQNRQVLHKIECHFITRTVIIIYITNQRREIVYHSIGLNSNSYHQLRISTISKSQVFRGWGHTPTSNRNHKSRFRFLTIYSCWVC